MSYNLRSPSVKRIMREAEELSQPTDQYFAAPLEENLFEWHFTIRGPADTPFDGGLYHGRILLPPDYPLKPPNIIMLTPNGRFEVGKKICLSISAHHPESWQPSWSIRTVMIALIGFLPTKGEGAVAALDYSPQERRDLAQKSQHWVCPICHQANRTALQSGVARALTKEDQEALAQLTFKGEDPKAAEAAEAAKKAANAQSPPVPASSTPSEPSLPAAVSSSSASIPPAAALVQVPRSQPAPPPAAAGNNNTSAAQGAGTTARRSTWHIDMVMYAVIALIIALLLKRLS